MRTKPFYPMCASPEYNVKQSIGIDLSRDHFTADEVRHLISLIMELKDSGFSIIEIRKSPKDIPDEYIGICNLYSGDRLVRANYIELVSISHIVQRITINKECS